MSFLTNWSSWNLPYEIIVIQVSVSQNVQKVFKSLKGFHITKTFHNVKSLWSLEIRKSTKSRTVPLTVLYHVNISRIDFQAEKTFRFWLLSRWNSFVRNNLISAVAKLTHNFKSMLLVENALKYVWNLFLLS